MSRWGPRSDSDPDVLAHARAKELMAGEVTPPGLLVQYLTPTGLNLPPGLSYDDWATLGWVLFEIERTIQWAIGDWWLYGTAGRGYGEAAEQAAPTGYALSTVKGAAWVAKVFEPSRRRDDLSFYHHREVAGLEPDVADRLLDKAAADALAVHALRELRQVEQRRAVKSHPHEICQHVGAATREIQAAVDHAWNVTFRVPLDDRTRGEIADGIDRLLAEIWRLQEVTGT